MQEPGVGRNGALISHNIDPSLQPMDEFMDQPRFRGGSYTSLVSLFGGEL